MEATKSCPSLTSGEASGALHKRHLQPHKSAPSQKPVYLRKNTTAISFPQWLPLWQGGLSIAGFYTLENAAMIEYFRFHKQDIESISGTPNIKQTDEDNAFLQTSKGRETTQRPEYTNKSRRRKKKQHYIIKLII